MATLQDMTPDQRVRLIVSGRFTPDALGDGYGVVLDAVRADPAQHLAAFDQLFLAAGTPRGALSELHLPLFLQILRPVAPEEVRRRAEALLRTARQVAREQIEAFGLAESAGERADLTRQRDRLDGRRSELLALAGGH